MTHQEKTITETKKQLLSLEADLLSKTDNMKMLELKLEETERTNDAKAEEIIRLEDELREMKSELNAAQATCENVQQNVSTGTSRFEMLLFGCE